MMAKLIDSWIRRLTAPDVPAAVFTSPGDPSAAFAAPANPRR